MTHFTCVNSGNLTSEALNVIFRLCPAFDDGLYWKQVNPSNLCPRCNTRLIHIQRNGSAFILSVSFSLSPFNVYFMKTEYVY